MDNIFDPQSTLFQKLIYMGCIFDPQSTLLKLNYSILGILDSIIPVHIMVYHEITYMGLNLTHRVRF